jgi:hypothetical protein
MKGRRLYPPDWIYPIDYEKEMQPGDYALFWNRVWVLRAPNGDLGAIHGGPHKITIHPDGSISVTPSVQFESGKRYHGWLTEGVWRPS